MKKFIFLTLSLLAINLIAAPAAPVTQNGAQTSSGDFSEILAQILMDEGEDAVKEKALAEANKALLSKDFWLKKIANLDTKFGYYEGKRRIFAVDKTAKVFYYYDYDGAKLIKRGEYKATMGDAVGDKLKEGDNKTPVGAYEITSTLEQGKNLFDPYYGPLAYTSNYPNILDKSRKKTGGGIWVHGFPLNNGKRESENTKGCVAIDNDALLTINKDLDGKRIELLINEQGVLEAGKDDLAAVLTFLFKWRMTWKNNQIDDYLALYSQNFTRNDGANKEMFAKLKRQIFGKGERKAIFFSDIEIVPYPNSLGETIFKVGFKQDYRAASHTSKRDKEIYVQKSGDHFQIILEN
ncbi:MAG: L,D-transpeptidase family protein [Helicobacteraceae bacterium]|jgi:murein L,D-transpeptidase YafK|nr:L,D-transpeptidase family protein [Helicobacteraceae bacterium]